jgi:hypothetical protein
MIDILCEKRKRLFRMVGSDSDCDSILPCSFSFHIHFAFVSPQTTHNDVDSLNIDAHVENTKSGHKSLLNVE